MKLSTKRTPEFYTDACGTGRARMPLSKAGTFAVLDATDMQALLTMGVSPNWFINKRGYVAVNIPRIGPFPVARLVMGAGDGERVFYTNGDKLNLQGDNLRITDKHSPRVNLAALLELQAKSRKAREATSAKARLETTAQRQARIWTALQDGA